MAQGRPILVRGQPVSGGAFPLVITPLVGRGAEELAAELDAILPRRPDMLEWRVDFFEAIADADAVIATAREIGRRAGAVPLLFTRRSSSEGGQPVPVDEPAVAALYRRVCEARCVDLIDYELSNAPAELRRLREVSAAHEVGMVMSYHNFRETPDLAMLSDRFAQAQRLGADVAKVAVMPQDPQDVLRLLDATWQASQMLDIPVISMAMGGIGAVSRMMGWMYGSAATFAVGKSSSAPGQMALEDLRAALDSVRRAVTGR